MSLSFLREVKLCVMRRSGDTNNGRPPRRKRNIIMIDRKDGLPKTSSPITHTDSGFNSSSSTGSCGGGSTNDQRKDKAVAGKVKAAQIPDDKEKSRSASTPAPTTPDTPQEDTTSPSTSPLSTDSVPSPSPSPAPTQVSSISTAVSSTPDTSIAESLDNDLITTTQALETRRHRPQVNDRADPPKPINKQQNEPLEKIKPSGRRLRLRAPRSPTRLVESRDRSSHKAPMLPTSNRRSVAAVFTGLLYFKQKAFIYPSHMPQNARTEVPRPSQFGIKDFEELVIPTNDGEKLSAFYIRAPKGARNPGYTVVMFHGNAGNIGHRLPIARMLINYVGCNVFMLEYRGYGLSTGEPDEAGLNVDAQTALDYLRDRHETSHHRYIIYGQSLGGAVSIKLVAQNQSVGDIAGLILENTFLSMRKLIPSVIPMTKYISILCHQVWPSDTLIPHVTVPILFLSGEQDEIVPPSHMRKLHELAKSRKMVWKSFPGGDHNSSVLEEGYFETITTFVNEISDELPIQGATAEDGDTTEKKE